jgi:hypothetical protein
MPVSAGIVADNIDTLILNVKLRQEFPLELAQRLDVLKEASQEAEEDIVTPHAFAGEQLFIKPHGAGKQWLRHTLPTTDRNKARWPTSPLWEAVQQATFFGDGVPAVRERKTAGDLLLICQMLAGCSTTASALLTNALPLEDDGTHFLIWFMNWLEGYLEQKGVSYEDITEAKRLKLGVVVEQAAA